MGELINLSGLTLNSEEARSTSELVFEKVFNSPEINQVHNVMTGVEMDRYIPILGQFGLLLKKNPGSCAVNDIDTQIPTSQKQWQPILHSFRLTHCQDDAPDLFKAWKKARIAANTWEEIDSAELAFLTDRITAAVKLEILRIADFSDKDADVIANGGVLTAGTDKTFFNTLDGMWKQIFTDQAGSKKSYRYAIAENNGASYVEQNNLASDAALNVLRGIYNGIDSRAFDSNLVIQMTRSLFNNWQDYLEDKSLGFTLSRAEQGSTQFNYRGIPIIVRHDWDRIIKTYFDNGTTLYLPHRAILTDLNNIPIGTSDEESFSSLDAYYWKKDHKHYTEVALKLDQKNLIEEEMAVAY